MVRRLMFIFMDPFLLKSGGQNRNDYYLIQSVGCFCCFNMEMQKLFNCQDEQGAREKTTHKKSSLQKQISKGILCHQYTKCVVIRNVRNEATISFIIFGDFWMFYQIFLSTQVKRCAIITYKQGIYELPNHLELRISRNQEISGNCLNFIE